MILEKISSKFHWQIWSVWKIQRSSFACLWHRTSNILYFSEYNGSYITCRRHISKFTAILAQISAEIFKLIQLILLKPLWWVCVCRSKRVSGTKNSLSSSEMLCRVSSYTFHTCSILSFPDAFSKGPLNTTCSTRSEFAVTLVAFRREDAFIDLIANSILGATMLSIAVKIAFWILSSTASTILHISLSILSLKHLSKVSTFTAFSLVLKLLPEVPTVKSWSLVTLITAVFSRFH